jgi:EAL domain-containing protein (putative c-di-GMP-specific phosphodiesterase class I)
VRAVAQRAESLDIRPVAVGVETEQQERMLRANGRDWFQGLRRGRTEPPGE